MKHLFVIAGILILICISGCGEKASTVYVSPDGDDAWSGLIPEPNSAGTDGPFATLDRARDSIREMKAGNGLPAGGITVQIRGGLYELPQPFILTGEDSGTETAPITYRASDGETVRIVGGRVVTGWTQIADSTVLKRLDEVALTHLWNLDEGATSHIWQADLSALGITDLEGINSPQTYQSDPGMELFYQDVPMILARYPNAGYMYITDVYDGNSVNTTDRISSPDGKFLCDDTRQKRWVSEKDIWLHGFWVWDWADMRIPLDKVDPKTGAISFPPKDGRAYTVRPDQWFYAQNVLPELDSPGEWYLDRETSMLYFWPPSPISSGKAVVSVVRNPIQCNDVSHVTLKGLVIEDGRGSAVVINGGDNVRIVACTIRNMGKWAVRVTGGARHGVVGCDIYQTGQGGVHLEGGDRKTLVPAGHYADNNHIHHTSRWDPVYQQAVALYGVGNSATHNYIAHVPHIAIGFSGNEQTIEYNEIYDAVFQSNDAGAVYTSPPDETWSMRGHKIRYNYLHDIMGFKRKGCFGVYLDDCFSSAEIYGNIFYDVATPILIGGGRDNIMTNNMFINCGKAFIIDARGLGWANKVGVFATKELHDLNYTQPPWSEKYPELLNIFKDEPLAPKGNVMARNICWGGPWGDVREEAKPYVKVEDNLVGTDPLFTGKPDPLYAYNPPSGYGLAAGSPALKLGFMQVPFDSIGVYKSEDRASWPVDR